MSQDAEDRRQFSRVTFNAEVTLSQGAERWPVQLIDISLKGVLIETPIDWQPDFSKPFAITLTLSDETHIDMDLLWRHSHQGLSGFECKRIDIDSITHLRRLVELNLGDSRLLERELAALGC